MIIIVIITLNRFTIKKNGRVDDGGVVF